VATKITDFSPTDFQIKFSTVNFSVLLILLPQSSPTRPMVESVLRTWIWKDRQSNFSCR